MEAMKDYRSLPANVILDLADAIKAFHEETAKMNEYEHCIDEILHLILGYISVLHYAEQGIQTLLEEIKHIYQEDGEYLCNATDQLSKVVLQQTKQFGLYDQSGNLAYVFSADWCDAYTPILQKRTIMQKVHHTRGVEANGKIVDNGVIEKDLEDHIKYNKYWRPKRALFVDGRCEYPGELTAEHCEQIEQELLSNPITVIESTAPYH